MNDTNDTELLNWLEKNVMDLVCNDQDQWYCDFDVAEDTPAEIKERKWCVSVREAIKAAIKRQDDFNDNCFQ